MKRFDLNFTPDAPLKHQHIKHIISDLMDAADQANRAVSQSEKLDMQRSHPIYKQLWKKWIDAQIKSALSYRVLLAWENRYHTMISVFLGQSIKRTSCFPKTIDNVRDDVLADIEQWSEKQVIENKDEYTNEQKIIYTVNQEKKEQEQKETIEKKTQLKSDFHHAEKYIQDTIENMPVVDVTFPESWNDMLSELRVYWRQIKDIQDKRTICDILPARIKINEMDTFITHNLTALVNKLCKTANALVEKDWNAPMESANDLFSTANIKKEIIICTKYLSIGCDLRDIEECIEAPQKQYTIAQKINTKVDQ